MVELLLGERKWLIRSSICRRILDDIFEKMYWDVINSNEDWLMRGRCGYLERDWASASVRNLVLGSSQARGQLKSRFLKQ